MSTKRWSFKNKFSAVNYDQFWKICRFLEDHLRAYGEVPITQKISLHNKIPSYPTMVNDWDTTIESIVDIRKNCNTVGRFEYKEFPYISLDIEPMEKSVFWGPYGWCHVGFKGLHTNYVSFYIQGHVGLTYYIKDKFQENFPKNYLNKEIKLTHLTLF